MPNPSKCSITSTFADCPPASFPLASGDQGFSCRWLGWVWLKQTATEIWVGQSLLIRQRVGRRAVSSGFPPGRRQHGSATQGGQHIQLTVDLLQIGARQKLRIKIPVFPDESSLAMLRRCTTSQTTEGGTLPPPCWRCCFSTQPRCILSPGCFEKLRPHRPL